MITTLTLRQLFIGVAFGFAILFELFCAYIVFKRDPYHQSNRFTSLAYLSLSLGLSLSVIYVIISDQVIVEILHRITNFANMVTAILLFLAAVYISEGKESLRSYRMAIVAADLLLGLYLIVSPGITVFTGNNTSGGEQLIMWNGFFFIEATFLLYITNILTCYYYFKIWRDVPSDSPIKRASSFIIGGTFLLPVSHFLLVLPLVLRSMNIEINSLGFTALGSIGVLLASLFITMGYRTKISDRIDN